MYYVSKIIIKCTILYSVQLYYLLGIPGRVALTCTHMYVFISIAAISSLQKVVICARA